MISWCEGQARYGFWGVLEAAEQPDGIVTKALYARTPRTPRTAGGAPSGVLHTTVVPAERWCDPSISATAHLVQATQPKIVDVRVTVVGRTLFAAEIHSGGALDWRRDHRRLSYRRCEVPDEIAEGVLALMGRLGLVFAALDFVVNRDGSWVFLEINPNGQWAWIERQTGQPISRALASILKGAR